MSLTCFVIDDHISAAEKIAEYIKRAGLLLLGLQTDPVVAMEEIRMMNDKPDVVFLDISMPVMNGLEVAEQLKEIAAVIFTTAHRSYAPESYKLNAVYYLLKPVTYDDFLVAVNKVMVSLSLANAPQIARKEFITIPGFGKGGIIRIKADEIIYLKSAEHYVEIFSTSKNYIVHRSMRTILGELGGYPFIRVHKSYAVNIQKVIEVKDNTIYLNGGLKVDLGSSYKDEFLKLLQQ